MTASLLIATEQAPIRIMLMGYGEHGKGTFCDIAREHFQLNSVSSSMAAAIHFLYDKIRSSDLFRIPDL